MKARDKSKRPSAHTNPTEKLNAKLRDEFADDLRGPNAIVAPIESPVVNPTIPIIVQVDANVFRDLLLPVMSYAISRGFSLNTLNDSYIAWSWQYQSQLLLNAAQDGVPLSGMIPQWFALLYQAVIATGVNSRGGKVTYQMNITNTPDYSFEQLIGPPAFKHVFSLGVKTSALVNGLFPVVEAPDAYTFEKGQMATQQLWLFLSSDDRIGAHKHPHMHKMVESSGKNIMTEDVSAFAWFNGSPGGGKDNTGGWMKQVFHEVPIWKPIFSVFAANEKLLFNRAEVQLRPWSGDAITTGCMLVDGIGMHQLGMKTYPVAKYLDLNEYLSVLAHVVRLVINLRLQTAAFVENVKNDTHYYDRHVRCPLTIQELGLILRATCMLVYNDTKAFQGTYPRAATSPSDNEFVVYGSGIQTAPIPLGSQMLLPMFLVENILANRSRSVLSGKGKNPRMHVAVLGQFNGDRLSESDYRSEYVVDDVPVHVPCFADDSTEVEISFIDGYFSKSPEGYCAINDPVGIVPLVEAWNNWVQEMGDHFRRVGSIDADAGISPLALIGLTSHFAIDNEDPPKKVVTSPSPTKKKDSSDSVSRYRMKKYKDLPGPYGNRKLIVYSSAYTIFQELWSSYQQYMVTPVNKIDPGITPQDNTGFIRMAAFLREQRQLAVGAGSVKFSSLAERHVIMAELCIKTKFAQSTNQEMVLSKLEANGHAGLLGQISGALVGALGHAGVDVATQILGSVVPI